jgi:hypothetical protein
MGPATCDADLTCDMISNTCLDPAVCGGAGELCCETDPACTDGVCVGAMGPSAGTCQTDCGDDGQDCCESGMGGFGICGDGLTCDIQTNVCG